MLKEALFYKQCSFFKGLFFTSKLPAYREYFIKQSLLIVVGFSQYTIIHG